MEQCNICGKVVRGIPNLKLHMRVHYKNQIPNGNPSLTIAHERSLINDNRLIENNSSRVDAMKERIELIRLQHEKEKLEDAIYQERLQEQQRLSIEQQERSDRNFKEFMELPKKLDMIRKIRNNDLVLPDNAKRPKYADEIDEEDDYEDDEDYEEDDY